MALLLMSGKEHGHMALDGQARPKIKRGVLWSDIAFNCGTAGVVRSDGPTDALPLDATGVYCSSNYEAQWPGHLFRYSNATWLANRFRRSNAPFFEIKF
ncbi:hypothetical protein [Paraburkholderia sp. BR13444]|uniref:hypothetical protein n=1 Tax=Paraburkholderia sp. BR13444 TaxID=3236997 RepID=UPI0034CEB9BB